MRVLDTAVVVAAFASWHGSHEVARRELASRPRITSHGMVETLSVLTRLPVPHRVPGPLVAQFLARAFDEPPLELGGNQVARLVTERLPALDISGGAVYDALIAETTRIAGGELVTFDRRALRVYERVGCPVVLLG